MVYKQVLLLVIIILIMVFGLDCAGAIAGESRIEEIFLDPAATGGNPCNDGDFIVWVERKGSTYPCYFNMQTGVKGIINPDVKVANGITLRMDDGLVVYCDLDRKELWCTNLSSASRFGLQSGESRKLLTTEKEIGDWTVQGNDIGVFVGGGIFKDLYLIRPDATILLMSNLKGRDLYAYAFPDQKGFLWIEKGSNELYLYDLDQNTCTQLTGFIVAYGMLDVWKNKLVYKINHNGWQLYDLASGETSDLPLAGVPAFSMEHDHLYYDKDSAIYKMDLVDKTELPLVALTGVIRTIDYCHGELVYKCVDQPVCWRAGVADLEIGVLPPLIKPGASIPLQATAVYRNGFTQILSSEINWSSTQPEIATVENGIMLAKHTGNTEIIGEYEGITARTTITVKEMQSISIMPADAAPLQAGESLNLTAICYYTDGSSNDITREAVWHCSGNNDITREGVFTAREEGTTVITAVCEGITATTAIRIEAPSLPPENPAPWPPEIPDVPDPQTPQPESPDIPVSPAPQPPDTGFRPIVPAFRSSSSSSMQSSLTNLLLIALLRSDSNLLIPLIIELTAIWYNNIAGLEDLAIPALAGTEQTPFKDSHQMSASSRPAVEGLTRGSEQNELNPRQPLTRAEAAAILHRLYNLLQSGHPVTP